MAISLVIAFANACSEPPEALPASYVLRMDRWLEDSMRGVVSEDDLRHADVLEQINPPVEMATPHNLLAAAYRFDVSMEMRLRNQAIGHGHEIPECGSRGDVVPYREACEMERASGMLFRLAIANWAEELARQCQVSLDYVDQVSDATSVALELQGHLKVVDACLEAQ
jgi:hypothetical protein